MKLCIQNHDLLNESLPKNQEKCYLSVRAQHRLKTELEGLILFFCHVNEKKDHSGLSQLVRSPIYI